MERSFVPASCVHYYTRHRTARSSARLRLPGKSNQLDFPGRNHAAVQEPIQYIQESIHLFRAVEDLDDNRQIPGRLEDLAYAQAARPAMPECCACTTISS